MDLKIEDRYMRGFIAGGLAGFITFLWNLFAYHILYITTLRWPDFASAIIFRRKSDTAWEFIFSTVVMLVFSAFVGTIFSLIIPNIKSKFLWIKCWVYGIMIWLLIFAVTIMFKIPSLTEIPSKTGMAHFLSATIWGILLGVFLNYMDFRLKKKT